MNWSFLLCVHGVANSTTSSNTVPLYLSKAYTTMMRFGVEQNFMKFQIYENDLKASIEEVSSVDPYTTFLFADDVPDILRVSTKNTTYLNYSQAQFVDKDVADVTKMFLNLSTSPEQKLNYLKLVQQQVFDRLQGKWSTAVANLSYKPSFIFSCRNLPIYQRIVYFGGQYWLMISNSSKEQMNIENQILEDRPDGYQSYYHQEMELEVSDHEQGVTYVIQPRYLIPHFKERMHSYGNKAESRLVVCNYLRRYIQKQSTQKGYLNEGQT